MPELSISEQQLAQEKQQLQAELANLNAKLNDLFQQNQEKDREIGHLKQQLHNFSARQAVEENRIAAIIQEKRQVELERNHYKEMSEDLNEQVKK